MGGAGRGGGRESAREFLDAKPHPQPAIKHKDVNSYYSCFALAPLSEA